MLSALSPPNALTGLIVSVGSGTRTLRPTEEKKAETLWKRGKVLDQDDDADKGTNAEDAPSA